jgi:hypothetical protein
MYFTPVLSRAGALPKEPTDALPGTEQKIRVMVERAARREQLFHPLDGPPAHPVPQATAESEAPSWASAAVGEPLDSERLEFEEASALLGAPATVDAGLAAFPIDPSTFD